MVNKATAADDLRKLFGHKPYDGASNICREDGYFAASLEKKHGMTVEALSRLVGVRR